MLNQTQKQFVIEQLREKGSVTRNECLRNYISRLGAIIYNAVEDLPYNYKNVLILWCFEQMSWEEIAAVLDSNQGHSRMIFCCARWSLECTLSENGFSKNMLPEALELYGREIDFPLIKLDLQSIRKKIMN